jgi:outer membrane protein OmpA-like peptidoglycan-associated protein
MADIYRLIHQGRLAIILCMVSLAACAPVDGLVDVRGKPVPTAVFVFFDKESAQPQVESDAALQEAAAYLLQYDNTFARIVGHLARDEKMEGADAQRLDSRRSATVGTRLIQLGVASNRIQPLSAGRNENMAAASDSPDIDRRVDILFGVR